MYAEHSGAGSNIPAANNDIFDRLLPDCYLYISHLDEEYQYWMLPGYPDEIGDTMSSTFTPTSALGRSAPVYTYSHSGPRSVQINLEFHRDMFDEINRYAGGKVKKFDTGDDMAEHFIKALQAIAVPKYNLSNKAIEPPLVAVRFGREVFIKGIVYNNSTGAIRKI